DFKSPVSTSSTTRAGTLVQYLLRAPAVIISLSPKEPLMRVLPALAAILFALASPLHAQPRAGAIAADSIEAIVTVISVDQASRVVTVRGPRGNVAAISVPAEANNLDQVSPGARFRMRYVEALAVSITKGGKPSAGGDESVVVSPKGGTPGGIIMRTL